MRATKEEMRDHYFVWRDALLVLDQIDRHVRTLMCDYHLAYLSEVSCAAGPHGAVLNRTGYGPSGFS